MTRAQRTRHGSARNAAPPRAGVTLVELMVAFGVVLVLMSILLPAIGRTRDRAKDIEVLSEARQNGLIISSFAASNKGRFPLAWHDDPLTASWGWWREAAHFGFVETEMLDQINSGAYGQSVATALEARYMQQGQAVPWEQLQSSRITTSKIRSPSHLALLRPKGNWCCVRSGDARTGPIVFHDMSAELLRWYDLEYVTEPNGDVFSILRENGIGLPATTPWNGYNGKDR